MEVRRFQTLVDEVLKALWEDDPVFATACGVHDYDDRLGRMSPDAIQHHLTTIKGFINELERLDGDLSADEDADRKALLAHLKDAVLDWEVLRWHIKEPALYLDHALYGAFLLLARDFAPLSQRMECLAKRLREFRRLLEEGKVNIVPSVVPAVYLETALETLEGAKSFLSLAVPQAAEQLSDEALRREVLRAVDEAGLALTDFERFLQERIAPTLLAITPSVRICSRQSCGRSICSRRHLTNWKRWGGRCWSKRRRNLKRSLKPLNLMCLGLSWWSG